MTSVNSVRSEAEVWETLGRRRPRLFLFHLHLAGNLADKGEVE